jgi:hypothetical protein
MFQPLVIFLSRSLIAISKQTAHRIDFYARSNASISSHFSSSHRCLSQYNEFIGDINLLHQALSFTSLSFGSFTVNSVITHTGYNLYSVISHTLSVSQNTALQPFLSPKTRTLRFIPNSMGYNRVEGI